MNEAERRKYVSNQFIKRFGTEPQLWSRAPGRVDLMGSHTDYNMGYVMTMTINRDTWIVARPRSDRQVHVASANVSGESHFNLDDQIRRDAHAPWSNYVRGMASVMQNAGYSLRGFDGFVHSTVPFGSGLSSSAALEMAAAVTFQQVSGFQLDPVEMALFGQKAENEFVNVKTGILDQYSSAMGQAGRAVQLDCRNLTSEHVPIAAGLHVVICDTRAERNLVGSEYDDRRAQCEEGVRFLQRYDPTIEALRDVSLGQFIACEAEMPPIVAKRCRFIIEENQRVLDLAKVLPSGDADELTDLFGASYRGARDLFGIGAPAMETMMDAMSSGPGIAAARQAGAGFGGCMVALVEAESVVEFSNSVKQSYALESGIQPQIYAVTASAGAGSLSFD